MAQVRSESERDDRVWALARELYNGYRIWHGASTGAYLRSWSRINREDRFPYVRFAQIILGRSEPK